MPREQAKGPGLLSNWHRNESLFRTAHYLLSFAAFQLFAHYDRLPRPAGGTPGRALSASFSHPLIVFLLLVWLLVLTYRCAAWMRRRNDSLAVAIHPFWWLAASTLPFVSFLVMLIMAWRMPEHVMAEWQELNSAGERADGPPDGPAA